jgi:hypothetical protein
MADGMELRKGHEVFGHAYRLARHRLRRATRTGKKGATGAYSAGLDLKGWSMQTADLVKPIPAVQEQMPDKIPATVNQLLALSKAIADIDSYKHFTPGRLPSMLSAARISLDVIFHNVLFPVNGAECEVSTDDLQQFKDCLKTMQDIISSGDVALLLPIVETAYDILTRMAGDYADRVCPPETE